MVSIWISDKVTWRAKDLKTCLIKKIDALLKSWRQEASVLAMFPDPRNHWPSLPPPHTKTQLNMLNHSHTHTHNDPLIFQTWRPVQILKRDRLSEIYFMSVEVKSVLVSRVIDPPIKRPLLAACCCWKHSQWQVIIWIHSKSQTNIINGNICALFINYSSISSNFIFIHCHPWPTDWLTIMHISSKASCGAKNGKISRMGSLETKPSQSRTQRPN